MRKLINLLMASMLCLTLTVPAFASGVTFVPSITVKPAPEVVVDGTTVENDDTDSNVEDEKEFIPAVEVKNPEKEVVYTAPVEDLVVTAVSQVQTEKPEVVIPDEAVSVLKTAYSQLNDQEFKFSEQTPELVQEMEEKLMTDLEEQVTQIMEDQGANQEEIDVAVAKVKEIVAADAAKLMDSAVVTALFDVTVMSEELESYLAIEGNTIDVTFKADAPKDHAIVVMVYKEERWQLIENVVVNGDGTITCTFAHFCPVAIMTVPLTSVIPEEAVPAAAEVTATEAATESAVAAVVTAEEGGFVWAWIVLAAGVVIAVVLKRKGSKK